MKKILKKREFYDLNYLIDYVNANDVEFLQVVNRTGYGAPYVLFYYEEVQKTIEKENNCY